MKDHGPCGAMVLPVAGLFISRYIWACIYAPAEAKHIGLVALAHGAYRARHVSNIRHARRGALLVCHVGGVLVMWHL